MLKPNTSVQFMKLGMLSPDGACKAFDASGKTSVQKVVVLCERSYLWNLWPDAPLTEQRAGLGSFLACSVWVVACT